MPKDRSLVTIMASAIALASSTNGLSGAMARSSPTPIPSPVASIVPSPGPGAASGCQSRSTRYPWGRVDLRMWTPRETATPAMPFIKAGFATGAPFSARLVQAYGDDYGEARRTVIFEMADGCRRQFRAESFSDSDQALIAKAMKKHPLTADTAHYRLAYRAGQTSEALIASGKLAVYTTQHFAFFYGKILASNFYKEIARKQRTMEQVLQETGVWMEKQWLINRDVIGAPMPFANAADKKKIEVYLCGTGRPIENYDDRKECGASGAETFGVSAWALPKGSNVLTHEFGHVIQFYTGGFRDVSEAGPIWETGAEWNSFAISPSFNPIMTEYHNQLENGPFFSAARYGANPIMMFWHEKDNTRALTFGTWLRNLRTPSGATQEEFLPAFVRLAQADGVYPNGWISFADEIGWYGARLVAMDFLNQRTLLDLMRASSTKTWLPHFYTPLATTSEPNVFRPHPERALLQFGTHIVPLTPSGDDVTVTLTGATAENQAAWRFTLVAVDERDMPTYAPMAAVAGTGSATTTLKPPAGTKLYLAVTATPYGYESLGWQENGREKRGKQFPYSVKIIGAMPRTGDPRPCDPATLEGISTANFTLSGNTDAGRLCE